MNTSTDRRLSLYSAGSLRTALAGLIARFQEDFGQEVAVRLGPAGLLRAEIEAGARPDLFTSADMAQPRRLAVAGLADEATVFATNKLHILIRWDLAARPSNLLALLLDPAVRLGTSTPGKDPSGDYAWQMFDRAEALRPGAAATLAAKAQTIVGGTVPPASVAKESPIAEAFRAGRIDAFLGYASGMPALTALIPEAEVVTPPPTLAVRAAYSATVLTGAAAGAEDFVHFLLSSAAQSILRDAGFGPPPAAAERT